MPQTRETSIYAQRLILEYNRARKLLRKYFKFRHTPDKAKAKIIDIIGNISTRQSMIIGNTLEASYSVGLKEGNKIAEGRLTADSAGFDLTQVSDTHLHKITSKTIGSIGKYNERLSKQLTLQYDTLLADNTLMTELSQTGWSPAIEKALQKRSISPEVISLLKGQTSTAKMITILEIQGMKSGRPPREVAKLLLPHIQRHFGPEGVVIDNRGKFNRVLEVKPNGDFSWVKREIKKVYKATPKSYSNLIARSSMIDAHHSGRFLSLEASGLVDYYISHSILGPRTCAMCAMMHGNRVLRAEGPLYHGNCMCYLKPVWRKDSGLKNKNPEFYENQRDMHFLKENDLREFNKGMPRGAKIKYSSLLPEDAITKTIPSKSEMYEIRKAFLE